MTISILIIIIIVYWCLLCMISCGSGDYEQNLQSIPQSERAGASESLQQPLRNPPNLPCRVVVARGFVLW